MIRSAVTVSLVEEARGGPFVFWHDLPAACRRAAELGFDAVEIFPPSPSAIDDSDAMILVQTLRLRVAAVGTGAGWVLHKLTLTDPDPGRRREAIQFVRGLIGQAAEWGAPAIIGSMQGRAPDPAGRPDWLARLGDALDELGAYAATCGQPLLYEPLNRYETNLVNTVADGVKLVGGLSSGNVKLLCDLFHMNIEEADIAAALRAAGPALGHVHFVDSNRRAAGFGHLDYRPVAEALKAIGYAGYLSAEALPLPDPDAAAVQTMAAFRRWFA